jgi:hypothetical protein
MKFHEEFVIFGTSVNMFSGVILAPNVSFSSLFYPNDALDNPFYGFFLKYYYYFFFNCSFTPRVYPDNAYPKIPFVHEGGIAVNGTPYGLSEKVILAELFSKVYFSLFFPAVQ